MLETNGKMCGRTLKKRTFFHQMLGFNQRHAAGHRRKIKQRESTHNAAHSSGATLHT